MGWEGVGVEALRSPLVSAFWWSCAPGLWPLEMLLRFPPLRRDRMARVGWSWVFPFFKLGWALLKLQQVRLWWNSSSWGQGLLRAGRSDLFQNGYFPLPLPEAMEIFLWSSPWESGAAPRGKTHKCEGSPSLGPSQSCPHWASSNSLIMVQIFLPQEWFPWKFLFRSVVSLCILLSVSIILGAAVFSVISVLWWI